MTRERLIRVARDLLSEPYLLISTPMRGMISFRFCDAPEQYQKYVEWLQTTELSFSEFPEWRTVQVRGV